MNRICASRFRAHEDHAQQAGPLSRGDPPALFVKSDSHDRSDHHEARKSRKKDVVGAEQEEPADDRERRQEDEGAVRKAGSRIDAQIAPALLEPLHRGDRAANGGSIVRAAAPAATLREYDDRLLRVAHFASGRLSRGVHDDFAAL